MKLTLATFQQNALSELRNNCDTAQQLCKKNQCILSLSAPTGAGKTIIMANLIEDILSGSAEYVKQENAVFLWLSGWPELNEQSMNKIYFNANNLAPGTLIPISDDSFDEEVFAGEDKYKTKFDGIVAESDEASQHSLKLWNPITLPYKEDYKKEQSHMFVNKDGEAFFELDTWEKGVLEEEMKRPGFVCWIRNQQNKGWALCVKYEMDRKLKSFYPDFIVIRKENDKFVVDLLEPHNPAYNDNFAKTIGLCNYLKEEKGIARAEIIRKEDGRFLRLNVGDSMIQHDVMNMRNDDDLNNLFRKYNS